MFRYNYGMQSSGTQTENRSRRDLGMFVAFKPGQAVMVQAMGDSQRYWGRIIGTDPYEYLFVKLPMVPGITRLATAGASLTLRLETDGELFGFSCDVISATHKPYPLVALTYPTAAERLQLRKSRRVKCLIPAMVENDFFTSPAVIVDLSRGGCRLVLDMFQKQKIVNLMTGDKVNLSLALEPKASMVCPARVVSMADASQGRFLSASFDDADKDASAALGEFMDRLETVDSMLDPKG